MEEKSREDRLSEISFIINGLENNGPFESFIKLFQEQAMMADATWQNCCVEGEKGRNLFYELRSNKRAVINILNKLEELRQEKQMIEEEIEEENDEQSE